MSVMTYWKSRSEAREAFLKCAIDWVCAAPDLDACGSIAKSRSGHRALILEIVRKTMAVEADESAGIWNSALAPHCVDGALCGLLPTCRIALYWSTTPAILIANMAGDAVSVCVKAFATLVGFGA